jgi:hypothetical protein
VRQALNENPVAQVVMLGILGIVVAFLFMTRVMGGNDAAAPEATDTASTSTAAGVAPPATPSAPDASTPAPVAPEAAPVASEGVGFEAGEGLPQSVVTAHEHGDVVALLVVNSRGAEDNRLEDEIQTLRGRGDTTVFVAEAKDVARYSRIAEGVNLDRVPALVVIEPKRLAEGELPAASISYGFRGPESVQQAVRDALYQGKELPYHPG